MLCDPPSTTLLLLILEERLDCLLLQLVISFLHCSNIPRLITSSNGGSLCCRWTLRSRPSWCVPLYLQYRTSTTTTVVEL